MSFKVVFIDTGNLVGLIVQTIFSLDILPNNLQVIAGVIVFGIN